MEADETNKACKSYAACCSTLGVAANKEVDATNLVDGVAVMTCTATLMTKFQDSSLLTNKVKLRKEVLQSMAKLARPAREDKLEAKLLAALRAKVDLAIKMKAAGS